MIRKRSLYIVAALLLIGLVIYLLVPNSLRYLWILAFLGLHFGMHSMHGHGGHGSGHGGGHGHSDSHESSSKSQEDTSAHPVPDTMQSASTLAKQRDL